MLTGAKSLIFQGVLVEPQAIAGSHDAHGLRMYLISRNGSDHVQAGLKDT